MNARMDNPALTVPGALKALRDMGDAARTAGIPETTLELVNLRASQINGCSGCVDLHSRQLRRLGEPDARVHMVAAWRDGSYFTDAERAALALAEAATRIADRPDPVPDGVWEEAAAHYDTAQLAALVIAIAGINAFNRVNVVTRQVTGDWISRFVEERGAARRAA
jgi:AhpD family alkylhydroperoxidase